MDAQGDTVIVVIPTIVQFSLAWNYGVNFGFFASNADWYQSGLFALTGVLCLGIVCWIDALLSTRAQHTYAHAVFAVSGGLVIGGAIGNATDRIVHGAVVDFINMSCCGFVNPYLFNVADIAIFMGLLGLTLLHHRIKVKP